MYADTDKVFAGFVSGCAANPDKCVLARNNATVGDIERRIYDYMETVKYHPVGHNGLLIDWSLVRSTVLAFLYNPSTWPVLGSILDDLMSEKFTLFDSV